MANLIFFTASFYGTLHCLSTLKNSQKIKKGILISILLALSTSQFLVAQSPQLSNEWLSNNTQVINTELPSNKDMQLLKKEVGNKRIVFLGEATHEDGATFKVRTKIVELLMEEMYFDVVLFEAGMFDLLQANKEFQKTGKSESIKKALWGFWRNTSSK